MEKFTNLEDIWVDEIVDIGLFETKDLIRRIDELQHLKSALCTHADEIEDGLRKFKEKYGEEHLCKHCRHGVVQLGQYSMHSLCGKGICWCYDGCDHFEEDTPLSAWVRDHSPEYGGTVPEAIWNMCTTIWDTIYEFYGDNEKTLEVVTEMLSVYFDKIRKDKAIC